MRRILAALSLALVACGPSTGAADAEPDASGLDAPADVASEASVPDVPADSPVDVAPDARADSPVDVAPDARACATDMDRDGHVARSCGGDDCDDNNARVHPGQMPHCDATLVDSDCNGVADAMELQPREIRCRAEYRERTGMNPLAITVGCLPASDGLSCRACRSGEPQCTCWVSGETSTRSCARFM